MSWVALAVRVPPAERERVGAWLVAATGQAVAEQEDGSLLAYAEDGAAAERLARELGEAAAVERVALPDTDWTTKWRDGIGARRFGRLTVAPSWIDLPADGAPRVVLDPESAFGSGEHGSTRVALALLERHLRPGDRVVDLGSGSGILAIAAVQLGAASAIGIEIDEDAIPVAERNAERNGAAARARFLAGDAGALGPVAGPAEIVCSNILRTVNVTLLPAIRATLAPGGLAIFAGMEEPEEASFLPELAAAGFTVADEARDAGWWGVAARRP